MIAPLTIRGAKLLRDELEQLRSVKRPAVIHAIAEARAHGDLKENAEYHAAREQQSFIEGRIKRLEGELSHAQVIDVAALNPERDQTEVQGRRPTGKGHAFPSSAIVGQFRLKTIHVRSEWCHPPGPNCAHQVFLLQSADIWRREVDTLAHHWSFPRARSLIL